MPGTYLIHFTSVGKSPVQKEFSISANRRNVDLGKILIAEATEMLKGVEVVAQKPLVKAEIDKVTYSIEDDPDSKTNTTLEMLRKVPLVTVDGEDKIQVNGSSKFKVHVNGKPNNMMSNNPTEVLRSMPANSIKSIEVITEPGAKYDAEGVAGILNIITIGAGMEGYTVTLNGGASNMRVYGGGYGTVQSGKFTVTGNYSYNYQGSQKGFEDSYREDFTSQENKFLESHRRSKSYGNFQFGSLEGSYEIDTLNLISFSMNLMTGNFTNKRIGNTQMTNHAGNPVYGYGSLGNNESGFGEVGGNMDYQHSFKKKGELLTFSYRFSHSPNNSEANTDYEDTLNVPYLLQNQYFKNDASTQEHTAQLDYTNPINSIHSIETGIKYIFRRSKSDGKYYLADKTGEYKYDQDMSTQYDHKQDILAAFASGTDAAGQRHRLLFLGQIIADRDTTAITHYGQQRRIADAHPATGRGALGSRRRYQNVCLQMSSDICVDRPRSQWQQEQQAESGKHPKGAACNEQRRQSQQQKQVTHGAA